MAERVIWSEKDVDVIPAEMTICFGEQIAALLAGASSHQHCIVLTETAGIRLPATIYFFEVGHKDTRTPFGFCSTTVHSHAEN